ncbi:MAG: carboxypeptidase regulatory-like domain-containing protein, partial [Candidatus Eisenbacteria bacterium]|nr:carboxypeptidase regulatory-like domain-containing protein [Candidatus Eisenbacteria bacterium]
REPGCVDACPRYVRASSGHPYHSESSTWWGAARDGAQLLFRAIETTRDVEIDTSMYGPFGLRTFWPGVVYQSDQEVVEVEPGETAVVWLDALAGGTLRGRVVGSDGESLPTSMLPSLSFEILHENRGAFDVSVSQLEPDGGFSISGVPPGACRVVARVRGPNSEYRDTWWPNGGSSDEGETLTVYDGDKIHDLEIRMQQR